MSAKIEKKTNTTRLSQLFATTQPDAANRLTGVSNFHLKSDRNQCVLPALRPVLPKNPKLSFASHLIDRVDWEVIRHQLFPQRLCFANVTL